MQFTIGLTRISNSPPLQMKCANNNPEDFTWKDYEKGTGQIDLGNVELFSQIARDQSIKKQETIKSPTVQT